MQFLCNYKTALCKERALQKAIGGDLEDGLVSVPLPESGLIVNYPQVLSESLGRITDLTRPDMVTLADATQWGVDQHIHLAMQPARPSLADALRVLNRPIDPAASRFDGRSAPRMALTPKPEHGLVSIAGPKGLFYANAGDAFGVASAGRRWARLSSSARRWGLELVGNNEFPYYYFLTTSWI